MNRIVICASCFMLGAVAAFAEPISAEVTSTGKNGETEGYLSRYAAYLCTTDAAAGYFGGNSSYDTVTDWLKGNYATGVSALKGDPNAAMAAYGFDEGEYSFTKYFQEGLAGDYLAVLTYSEGGESWFRVFGNAADVDGSITMDPVGGAGSAGAWTQAAIPEPTGGLLILLGLAGLALKRKRM